MARVGSAAAVGVDERRHVLDHQESGDQVAAEVEQGRVLAVGNSDAALLDLDGLSAQNDAVAVVPPGP
jgi:hypothetical protein